MSVQAQQPSSIPATDSSIPATEFRKRARAEACINGVEDLFIQENFLQLYNTGVHFLQEPSLNGGVLSDNIMARNVSRKKTRPQDDSMNMAIQQTFMPLTTDLEKSSLLVAAFTERSNIAAPNMNSQLPMWPCPSGPPKVYESPYRPAPSIPNNGRTTAGTSMCSTLHDADLQLQLRQHDAEIHQIIGIYGERLKRALEDRRKQHTRALLERLDQCLLSCVREKMMEIDKIWHRNMELEEWVKRLSLESQVWQNVAQSQEVLVTSLRSNLEQVVAQNKEQSRGRFGESDAEDAESCIHGASEGLNSQAVKEIEDLREQRKCKCCRKNSMCILLLPCRHLCLCEDCNICLSKCPICGATKSGSLQVYID